MVTGLFLSFLDLCGKLVRILHKRLEVFPTAAPQIIKGLQDAFVSPFQLGKTGFGDEQPIAALILGLALFSDAVLFVQRLQTAAYGKTGSPHWQTSSKRNTKATSGSAAARR